MNGQIIMSCVKLNNVRRQLVAEPHNIDSLLSSNGCDSDPLLPSSMLIECDELKGARLALWYGTDLL